MRPDIGVTVGRVQFILALTVSCLNGNFAGAPTLSTRVDSGKR